MVDNIGVVLMLNAFEAHMDHWIKWSSFFLWASDASTALEFGNGWEILPSLYNERDS